MTQVVPEWAAGTYVLTFAAAQRNYQVARQDFRVVDGALVGTFTPSGTDYQNYATTAFTLAGGSHTITFQSLDTAGGDNTAFVDSIVVRASSSVTVSQATVLDKGFEQLNVGVGNFKYAPTGSPWAFSSGAGISGNSSGFTSWNPAAPEGGQVAFLQATGSMSQTITMAVAGTYVMTFQAAQRGGEWWPQAQDFQVLVDGVVVGTFKPLASAYQKFTTRGFKVAAGNARSRSRGWTPPAKHRFSSTMSPSTPRTRSSAIRMSYACLVASTGAARSPCWFHFPATFPSRDALPPRHAPTLVAFWELWSESSAAPLTRNRGGMACGPLPRT